MKNNGYIEPRTKRMLSSYEFLDGSKVSQKGFDFLYFCKNSKDYEKKSELRFWSKVEKTDSCWIWKANKNPDGYGMFHYGNYEIPAHRYSFILKNGEFPKELFICHTCDNPSCVNPDHLFLGDAKINSDDCQYKKRKLFFGEKNALKGEENINHKLTENNIREIRELKKTKSYSYLSEKYGVSIVWLCKIIKRKVWKHI